MADDGVEVIADFYDLLCKYVSLADPHIIYLDDDIDYILTAIANQDCTYQRRSAPASPLARFTEDVIGNMDVNIGLPLSKHVVGKSSWATER